MTPDELDLVDTDDLLAAIHRRCEAFVYLGMHERNDEADERHIYFGGGVISALGLVAWGKHKLLSGDDLSAVQLDDEPND
jgi:hypothetical protein